MDSVPGTEVCVVSGCAVAAETDLLQEGLPRDVGWRVRVGACEGVTVVAEDDLFQGRSPKGRNE